MYQFIDRIQYVYVLDTCTYTLCRSLTRVRMILLEHQIDDTVQPDDEVQFDDSSIRRFNSTIQFNAKRPL